MYLWDVVGCDNTLEPPFFILKKKKKKVFPSLGMSHPSVSNLESEEGRYIHEQNMSHVLYW